MAELPVTLELSGGAELLFNNVKTHNIKLPAKESDPYFTLFTLASEEYINQCVGIKSNNNKIKTGQIRHLLVWIRDNLLKERPELFLQGETVRPGILVLVNDADWELMGELDYEIEPNDRIVFISTLHGG